MPIKAYVCIVDDYIKTLKPIDTNDGSSTLYNKDLDETYHSTNGAYNESMHVFIRNGINLHPSKNPSILEIGFGTGLNAMVTLMHYHEKKFHNTIQFHSLEKYPLNEEITSGLQFPFLKTENYRALFKRLHQVSWEVEHEITPGFTLKKTHQDLLISELSGEYDIIYYDAFAPSKQPELWSKNILQKVVDTMKPNALFTTYCAKGEVRRTLSSMGLTMKRVPGPAGKREMLIGRKLASL